MRVHVIHGNGEDAIDAHLGDQLPILHSAQGRLVLSSYRNEAIRSAVHRLNAEETDPARQVKINDLLVEFAALREKGWAIEEDRDGAGCVAVLLPFARGMDRLTISIVAKPAVIAERGEELLELLLARRSAIADFYEEVEGHDHEMGNVVQMPEPVKIASYHRHYA